MPVLPPYIPPDLNLERVDFDVDEFRVSLLSHGRRLWWEAACECPCRQALTIADVTQEVGESQGDCEGCRGSGIVYEPGQQIVGMVQGVRSEFQRYNQFGANALGLANITLLPEHLPGTNDRLTLIDGVRVHTESGVRRGTTQALRYPIISRDVIVGAGAKLTTKRKVTLDVLYARSADSTGTLTGTTYVKGTHFTVENGVIDYTVGINAGIAPPLNTRISFRYLSQPRFVVIDHVYVTRDLFNRNFGDLDLGQHPVNVLTLLEHLGNRNPPVANFSPSPTFVMPG